MRILLVADEVCKKYYDFYEPGMFRDIDLIISAGDLPPQYLEFLTTLSNWFTNLNLTDMETCYKVFRTPVIKEILPSLQQDRFGFEPEITSRVARAGLRVYEVGISYNGRTYAEGKHIGWKDGFRAIWCILKYR